MTDACANVGDKTLTDKTNKCYYQSMCNELIAQNPGACKYCCKLNPTLEIVECPTIKAHCRVEPKPD